MAVGTSSSMLGGALLLLLLLVLSSATDFHDGSSSSAAPLSPLDDLCISLGSQYVTPDVCVAALCVDPSCRSTRGLPELAALAIRLTAANATVAKASIESSLAHATDAETKKAMRSCLQLYAGAVEALQWATRSVAAGQYRGAREAVQAAVYVPSGCDGMAQVALPRENDDFFQMAFVGHAVLAWVQHSIDRLTN
ncbi:hypothetical protein ZWY2020_031839 [Hordeum vulgare]|nr:hypothetical protein ZWY2020_031839 [Hordeum vulgare]